MADYLNDGPDEEFVSKTQRKKQMDALQDLGRELLEVPNDKLKKLDLPEDLLTALLDYKRISAFGAKKRQEQYIGKLMRDIDPEPIRAHLAVRKGESAAHTGWLHQVERWRERLLEDDKTLPVFINEFPQADIQQLRNLIRNARKEKQEAKPPKHFRQLFQAIKEIIPEPAIPGSQDAEDEA
ncbi:MULTISPECIES: ribosome biogenesis factor YjgA [unclassified Paludibacterium]|uniref:ribosome biogenesis factor YjgA n=1 Tax=unclassified Paludibacterium TaxID=2618429 RepID=UPI001C0508BC|nr:ribosome biogenesis factor YjgA [Paludibacterium sp. B53371]BEV70838.1 ribosome biogenesis factor YjgA [Paludibacterium sp. THUN1379]